MPLASGTRLGPYEIASALGAGGMGEVYRARDTKLNRDVALKILPDAFAGDPDRLARFTREAQTLAALNHPHIAHIHGLEESAGVRALVMELVEGEDLAQRIARGPMPADEALPIAKQTAEALEAAHEQGIVHRDLKPANIKIRADGTVKVLDFGLAKAMDAGRAGAGLHPAPPDASPTLTTPAMTAAGVILGTAAYMSPEQAKGAVVDKRADIWAFGCVLFEMLTGRQLFTADTISETLAAVMRDNPCLDALPRATPSSIRPLLARCLDRDPRRRLRDIGEARVALEAAAADSRPTTADSTSAAIVPRRRRAGPWVVAGIALGIAATLATIAIGRGGLLDPASTSPTLWLSILPPPQGFDLAPDPTVSPDGRYVAFKALDSAGQTLLWVKPLDSPDSRALRGTEGSEVTCAPFWSPDSKSIAFFAGENLKRVDLAGGSPQVLARAPNCRGGSWSRIGVIVFNGDSRTLVQVPATGGAIAPVSAMSGAKDGLSAYPWFLPDGRHFLFSRRPPDLSQPGIYVASLDGGTPTRVSSTFSPAAFANNYLLFAQQGALFAQPFDSRTFRLTGDPTQIADRVGRGFGTVFTAAFSASENGTIAYWSGTVIPRTQLTWLDRAGRRLDAVGEVASHVGFAMSSDGKRAAVERQDLSAAAQDIWIVDVGSVASASGATKRTTDGRSSLPVWSPDGSRLALMSAGRGLAIGPTSGGESMLVSSSQTKWPTDWSSDGQLVIFSDQAEQETRLWTVAAKEAATPVLYLDVPFGIGFGQFAPDRRWLAYVSNESGRYEVYLDSFPKPGDKRRVSTAGGAWSKWRRDGKELYYLAPDRKLMAVDVRSNAGDLSVSLPHALFEGPAVGTDSERGQFAPNVDGSRFLFNARVDDGAPVGLTVIANWPALLVKGSR